MDIDMMENLAKMANKKRNDIESPCNGKKKNKKDESIMENGLPENNKEEGLQHYLYILLFIPKVCFSMLKLHLYLLKIYKWKI